MNADEKKLGETIKLNFFASPACSAKIKTFLLGHEEARKAKFWIENRDLLMFALKAM